MQRKRPVTAVEILAARLRDKGYTIDAIRQPIPSRPGIVSFHSEGSPKDCLVIKVLETFLGLQDDLIERIAEAERERACRKEDTSRDETEPSTD